MEAKHRGFAKPGLGQRLLRWANLRPEESERTFLMFAFYTATSIGLVWLEAVTADLFLKAYGAEDGLPWIYLASAFIGSGLSFIYSRLQRFLPLRQVVVIIAVLMSLPLLLLGTGLLQTDAAIVGVTIFLMRLWIEAINVLSDLNTSITANQLFNIREIKRTYPLISSGILVADVISGFSLAFLIKLIGRLELIIFLSFTLMAIGAMILFYLSRRYWQAFPDSLRRRVEERQPDFVNRRLQGPMRRYVVLLFAFFILAQVLFLLIDFEFLGELENRVPEGQIAVFLGIFNGMLGIFEVAMQWLASSRMIERMGVFAAAIVLPGGISILGTVSATIAGLSLSQPLFISLVLLKFLNELLHYTLFASIAPVLFQPIPDTVRSNIQAVVRGIAEPISTGITGLVLLLLVGVAKTTGWILPAIVVLAVGWVGVVWLLRSKYVGLLVMSAERGQLSADVDLRELKQAVIKALEQPGTDAHKASCIELLSQLDPRNAGEVLAPMLAKLPPRLQKKSLEEMLKYPSPAYLEQVQELIALSPPPDVLAVALRYGWITQESPDIRQLKPYLRSEVDPVVRGTAASLMLRLGNPTQKAEATNTLRLMLTHKQERERVMGCLALGEAVYMQALRLYIPNLLQDESLRVRCALLEAIAATHLEEFYPSLLRGLYYKSTRASAMRALVRLENEAIPMLVDLGEDIYKPELVRVHAWKAIGEIGTIEAIDALIAHLQTAWGNNRRNILKILLEVPNDQGIESVLDMLGRSGVERMINQELMFMGQLYAALIDLAPEQLRGQQADFLRRTLRDLQSDAQERLFLLMKFLYPLSAINAAAFNLHSTSRSNMAQGLEILDNTLDIPSKRALISILDRGSDLEKLQNLSELVGYQPLSPSDRLRHLLDLRHFLSDWSLACCFHLAREARWRVTPDQTIACLNHPKGFVREAVLSYLQIASPRALQQLLPRLQKDPDPLVAGLVQQIREAFQRSTSGTRDRPNVLPDFPNQPGFETI